MPDEQVFIGLGSNIGDSENIIISAIDCIAALPSTSLVKKSSIYSSKAVSDVPQDDYLNAVVLIESGLEPTEMLLELQAIEYAFYRQRDDKIKWGPRTLDLDIILFGNRNMSDSHLTIPHQEMTNRLFVLEPMMEIAGDFYITGAGSLEYLIQQAPEMSLLKLA